MKTLMVFQNSEASAILDAAKTCEPSYSVYPDGSRVKYPVPIGTQTKWVQPKAESSLTFEDACGLWPHLVGEDQSPSWGQPYSRLRVGLSGLVSISTRLASQPRISFLPDLL